MSGRRYLRAFLVGVLACGVAAAQQPEPLRIMPRLADAPAPVHVTGDASAFDKPGHVILTAEKYQELLETIEQLRRQANPEKPEVPSVCRLSGRVGSDIVKLQATFEYRTVQPKATIVLGCRRASAVAATLDDGKLPPLISGPNGLSVVVDTPGAHKLVLELELPLISRAPKGSEIGFGLDLPGCPITLFDQFELPEKVSRARLSRSLPSATPPIVVSSTALRPGAGQPPLALGAVSSLELAWDPPAVSPAEPLLTADERVTVRVDESSISVSSRLTLKPLRGGTPQWEIVAPPGAEVSVTATDVANSPVVERPADAKKPWVIRPREPADEVRVDIQLRLPRKGPMPVGPFQVLGVARVQGTVTVTAPNHLRPRVSKLRADVIRRESEDGSADLVFAYGAPSSRIATPPILFVDAEVLRGDVGTWVSHHLTLDEGGWRLTTDIRAMPVRTELTRLELDLPPELTDVRASPLGLVASLTPRRDLGPNRWEVKLAGTHRAEVQIRVEGFYTVPPNSRDAELLLPRVVQSFDTGGRVSASVSEGFEVRGSVRLWERDRISEASRSLGVETPRAAARADLAWKPVRPEQPIDATADVTLRDDRTAVVKHRLRLPPSPTPRIIRLRSIPGLPPEALRSDGGVLRPMGGNEWEVPLPPSPSREQSLVLHYTSRMEGSAKNSEIRVSIGLLWAVSATRCDTRVRVWSMVTGEGWWPHFDGGPWEPLPPETASDREGLAQLVLQGSGVSLPLRLRLTSATGLARSGVVIDRMLIRSWLTDAGLQVYRMRCRMARVAAASLDIELPGPRSALNLEVVLNGKPVTVFRKIAADPSNATTDSRLRLDLPPSDDPILLEVGYQMPPRREEGLAGRWELTLAPARILDAVHVGAVRWQIYFPDDGCVTVYGDGARLDQRWVFHRGLFTARQAVADADMNEWFDHGAETTGGSRSPELGVIARQAIPGPIHLVRVHRTGWMLICSLAVLLPGLLLYWWRAYRVPFWSGLMLSAVIVAGVAILWPLTALHAGAGALPGAVVLVPMLILWAAYDRRLVRRQLFMPGFSRSAGSAHMASHGSARRRDASTADIPPVT